jgi:2-keto-4-pentenoate hydratase/2-oxohepta-3-ene-1,7-dioic acid hydratase in catechol pathway
MKIIRYKKSGQLSDEINFGILINDEVYKINGNIFSDFSLGEKVAVLENVELQAPVEPENIIAIGLNYKHHAEESGLKIPDKPIIFIKATNSLTGPNTNIILPRMAPDEVDYEAELAVVIGKECKNVEVDQAGDYILGYTCANDVSARDCQIKIDKQWARAKSFDTFCPLGPVIETDLDPDNCQISSVLNGQVMQNSNTSDMIFDTAELISYLSKNMTLKPGTVILTGTPEGVGFARDEAVYLKPGDTIEIKIEGIGKLKNKVVLENQDK